MLDLLLKKMKVVTAAGGMVINSKEEILFIYRNHRWDLPKGKTEKDESIEDSAIREVEEETGVQGLEIKRFITRTFHIFKRNGKLRLKETYWYEMYTEYEGELVPEAKEGIKKAKWKNYEKTQKALTKSYANILMLFPERYLAGQSKDPVKERICSRRFQSFQNVSRSILKSGYEEISFSKTDFFHCLTYFRILMWIMTFIWVL